MKTTEGIGMVYFRGMEPFLDTSGHQLNLLEVEPQTLWYQDPVSGWAIDEEANKSILSYNLPVTFHGVGAPIGGTMTPPLSFLTTLKKHQSLLNPMWFSEHMSFNYYKEGHRKINTSFLLPPLQNEETKRFAIRNIKRYQKYIDLPFSFETNVNYLQPQMNEIPDGKFAAMVAEQSDCGILLDMHNIWVNEKNGRQKVSDFVSDLPHERVTEIHLAGGFYLDGYYLDAHSGPSSTHLNELALRVIRQLPNLKAIIFEMLPDFAQKKTTKHLQKQFESMQRMWDERGRKLRIKPTVNSPKSSPEVQTAIKAADYESALGKAVLQRKESTTAYQQISLDPGIPVMQKLVFSFRSGVIVSMFPYSCRYMRLKLGEEHFTNLLNQYFMTTDPELIPGRLTFQFNRFIKSKVSIPLLHTILEFELKNLRSAVDGKARKVKSRFDLQKAIDHLDKYELPEENSSAELIPSELIAPSKEIAVELTEMLNVYHA